MSFPEQSDDKPLVSPIPPKGKGIIHTRRDASFSRKASTFFSQHGKKIIRIGGIIGLVVSAYFLAVGIYSLSQGSTNKDSQDFFPTWHFRVERDSAAVVIGPDVVRYGEAGDIGEISSLKAEASGLESSGEIFVGAGDTEDVRAYLDGTEYDMITRLRLLPMSADYQRYEGGSLPADPGSQVFWSSTKSGEGTQSLVWNPQDNLSLVLMNADGSSGIAMDVLIKTQVAVLFNSGIINLLAGFFLSLLSLMAVSYTNRGSRNPTFGLPLGMLKDEKEKSTNSKS
jgi:hypothetical protein